MSTKLKLNQEKISALTNDELMELLQISKNFEVALREYEAQKAEFKDRVLPYTNVVDEDEKKQAETIVRPMAIKAKETQAAKSEAQKVQENELTKWATKNGLAVKNTACAMWIMGDTKPHRNALKKFGFKWSPKRQAWFFPVRKVA